MRLGAATAHLLGLTVMQWSCAGAMSGIRLGRSCPPSFREPFSHGQSTGRRAALLIWVALAVAAIPMAGFPGGSRRGEASLRRGLNANAEGYGRWVRGAESGHACASAERNIDLFLGPCVNILHARIALDHLHHTDAQSTARSQHSHCHASNCPRC